MSRREETCSSSFEWEFMNMHITAPGEISLVIKIMNQDLDEDDVLWKAFQTALNPWLPHIPFKVLLVSHACIVKCHMRVKLTEVQSIKGEIPSIAEMLGYKELFISLDSRTDVGKHIIGHILGLTHVPPLFLMCCELPKPGEKTSKNNETIENCLEVLNQKNIEKETLFPKTTDNLSPTTVFGLKFKEIQKRYFANEKSSYSQTPISFLTWPSFSGTRMRDCIKNPNLFSSWLIQETPEIFINDDEFYVPDSFGSRSMRSHWRLTRQGRGLLVKKIPHWREFTISSFLSLWYNEPRYDKNEDTDHPNLLPMVGFQKKSQYEISVVTLLPSERLIQLQTEIYEHDHWENANVLSIARGLFSGLAWMHSFGIPHGHITPETVFLNDSLDSGYLDLYPEGRVIPSREYSPTSPSPRYHPIDRVSFDSNLLPSSPAADVYSLGLVLWFLITKSKPFSGISSRLELLLARSRLLLDYLPEPENCPFDFEIVRSCCALDPSSRPSAAQIVELFDHHKTHSEES